MNNPGEPPRDFRISDAGRSGEYDRSLERTDVYATATIAFTLRWQCENAHHGDTFVVRDFDCSSDTLHPALNLLDKRRGHVEWHDFSNGELLEPFQQENMLEIPSDAFAKDFPKGLHVEPRHGRFYPRGIVAGTARIQAGDTRPLRVTGITRDRIAIDLNHPLACHDLRLDAQILHIRPPPGTKRRDRPALIEMICHNGPGMQARWQNQATDFFSGQPFERVAAEADGDFYAMPRITGHVDRTASSQITHLYEKLLPRKGRVLDLMSSVESHLPAKQQWQVTGLGMNAEELAANPQLCDYCVHDLNQNPDLPFADASFDAAVCSLSVEYLIRPFDVFSEVARVLKPGAPFALTFSNRWFPPKVIHAWQNAHDFERPAIVLEYFLRDRLFERLTTRSIRGLARPADDHYARVLETSDPVFAVWGYKC